MNQKSMAALVAMFNADVLKLPQPEKIQGLSDATFSLTLKQLNEEISEFELADEQASLASQADALLDLVYFALGALYKMGFTSNEIDDMFVAIHTANMTKTKGVKASRHVEGAADAVKPDDFHDPKHIIQEIIDGHTI